MGRQIKKTFWLGILAWFICLCFSGAEMYYILVPEILLKLHPQINNFIISGLVLSSATMAHFFLKYIKLEKLKSF